MRRLAPHQSAHLVAHDTRSLLKRRGWKHKGDVSLGYYQTPYGSWFGGIERRGDRFRVYLENPPINALELHEKWICFHKRKNDWWEIHMHTNPHDRDHSSIIFYVERLISESFKLANKN